MQLSDYNDPYYLKKQYDITNVFGIENHIESINNNNSLNYILFLLKAFRETKILQSPKYYLEYHEKFKNLNKKMLIKCCMINNISNPEYIKSLLHAVCIFSINTGDFRIIITKALIVSLQNKSYDIIPLLFTYRTIMFWDDIIRERYKNETNVNLIEQELKFLLEKNILDESEMDVAFYSIDSRYFPLKTQVCSRFDCLQHHKN
jgi:hypothetical protein